MGRGRDGRKWSGTNVPHHFPLDNYDLAGDVTSWNHPAGFTITHTINTARQITQVSSSVSDATDPATLATITYTPFGSVSTVQNGCVGSGCKSLQETYAYNTLLQPAYPVGSRGVP